ncbi:hypothetical protein QQS21_002574 [Conoideocrella luteorostrata]|uniref:Xylanolytic transcriptional activator regulatory domain-containing protein n=1 Tax=Conoideocrella luteorostrata TaxID=1105319 RepID=A0AAJ0CUU8_9HYPO|nr:hypothetical protein QQS21_002574 [Conoideocrella luteorostrata]
MQLPLIRQGTSLYRQPGAMDHQSSPQRSKKERIANRDRKRAARAYVYSDPSSPSSAKHAQHLLTQPLDATLVADKKRNVTVECLAGGVSGSAGSASSRSARPSRQHQEVVRRLGGISQAASERDSTDLARRMAYLERIAQRCAGESSTLDLDMLKHMAEAGNAQPHASHPDNVSSQGSDSERVDDKFSVEPIHENITHYSGEFSHWNFSMRIKKWIDQGVPNDSLNQPAGSVTNFKEYYRAEELQSPAATLSSLSRLPPRSIAEFLINCFFTHAEANYCFVERRWLNNKLDLVYDRPSSVTRRNVGVVCTIFGLLAIGTQYAYLETLAHGTAGRFGNDRDPMSGTFSEDAIGVVFYQQASQLLSDVITVSSLECVQACLLMGIYTLPIDASGLSYVYLNLALKLAIQNGMHRNYSGSGLDAATCETKNRVWWTIYTIEKRIGIFHGRPTSISNAAVDADFPTDNVATWPSLQPTHHAQILATLELNQKLDRLSRELTILSTSAKAEMNDSLARLVDLQRDLESWWTGLPDEIACKEPTALTNTSRGRLHLKLEYCLVRMFIGRVFILPQLRQGDTCSISESSPKDSSTARLTRKRLRAVLVGDCIKAAMLIIDTCRAIRNSIGLARASYTEFSSCRAALLVITTQCLQQRTYRFQQALRDGLSMLKEMSSGSASAHSETSLIQAFERAISNIYSDQSSEQSSGESEYRRFQRWQQSWQNDPSLTSQPEDSPGDNVMPMVSGTAHIPTANTENHAHDMVYATSCTPFFGVDGTFASFPQNPEDLSSFFGADFGSGQLFGPG